MIKLSSKEALTVVLVEPAGPLNIGSVARLCANFAITDLRLVAPRCDPTSPESRRMAVHGAAVLEQANRYPTLLDAVADCRRVVATCGRLEHGDIPLQTCQEALPWLLESRGLTRAALVFGREDHGLTNQELRLCHRVLTLQTAATYPSLNLSHAVAVVLHELHRHQTSPEMAEALTQPSAPPPLDPCPPKELDACLEDAQDLLLEVGFLLNHTAQARMAKVRGLIQRAAIRSEEVALLRGMVRQLRWAINSRHP
ncbi:MAG TPA: RNA methyltransferase [Prochlorococcaceae cyanobacterium Fu_MAG_50]|nr:RNA methyltransferase [Prochlorococcaceae cyanobacterium Fu_MAG_50]